jgi:hypothetical protein
MQRRRFLGLIGSGGAFTIAGCLDSSETESTEQRTESAITAPASGTTPTATVSPRIRQWAMDAESQDPTRPDGTPVSVDQTITDYAQELLDDMDLLPGWTDRVLTMQRNWIGRSEGAEVEFEIAETGEQVTVFTTRPDTLWGVTFFVFAPEHPMVAELAKAGGTSAELALSLIPICRGRRLLTFKFWWWPVL